MIPQTARVLGSDDVDVLASLLDMHRLETVVAGRIDLTPPWRLEGEPTDLLTLLVQARGESCLVPEPGAEPTVIRTGDIVIRPHGANGPNGSRSYLHDGSNPPTVTRRLEVRTTPTPTPKPLRLGRGDTSCSLVFCLMRTQSLPRGPLWDSLPELMHVPAGRAGRNGMLRRTTDSIIEESAEPGPAGTRLLSRLAETLLILALRVQAEEPSGGPGLRSLLDPVIAPAVQLIHTAPAEPWSVASLAARCGLSRSAFAARFARAVGETPSAYLAGWRIATAGHLLITTDESVGRIAETVGYASEAAFRLAFVSRAGISPREYRRRHGS
jgi:AraC-like DNA-binding protein